MSDFSSNQFDCHRGEQNLPKSKNTATTARKNKHTGHQNTKRVVTKAKKG